MEDQIRATRRQDRPSHKRCATRVIAGEEHAAVIQGNRSRVDGTRSIVEPQAPRVSSRQTGCHHIGVVATRKPVDAVTAERDHIARAIRRRPIGRRGRLIRTRSVSCVATQTS